MSKIWKTLPIATMFILASLLTPIQPQAQVSATLCGNGIINTG